MILVRHYVAPSPIHGLGVFTREQAKKGDVIWRFEPTFDVEIPERLLEFLLDPYAETVRTNAEYFGSRRVFRLGNDGDIFMNHSDNPSLIDLGDEMVAAWDLKVGDELTCDYRNVVVLDFSPPPKAQLKERTP
ncbi:SET domain-containing protein-lysine N-methyltransferase [Rhodovulum visakhapatnamense]|uniref:SET domain-containing protein n=1 Tax=Rhodovulum visakhapatnamense TaxID=364297 RepID=A0A4R8FF76_9RHOB|nr:SET domain-containing protein-lysine N-methyltransferase [Rhodovulum visakhapatnamense]TDX20861.1 hypothetical protein EV657_1503 [Rhodovulum visakhapatnamense]